MPLFFDKKNATWPKWISEFIVVVIGVMVALGVDNYRDFRQDRNRENIYLENLSQDLDEDLSRIGGATLFSRNSLYQLESLLAQSGLDINQYALDPIILEDGYNREEIDSASVVPLMQDEYVIWPAGLFDVFIPKETTYTTLLTTGELRVILDEELRRSISNYYESVRSRNEDRSTFETNINSLNEFLSLSNIDVYNPTDVNEIHEVPGVIPYLTRARDSQFWWYVRKLHMQEELYVLLEKLNRRLGRDG